MLVCVCGNDVLSFCLNPIINALAVKLLYWELDKCCKDGVLHSITVPGTDESVGTVNFVSPQPHKYIFVLF